MKEDLKVVVGKNIKERRQLLGLSQKELAIQLDVTQDAMNRMERGVIFPRAVNLQKLAEILKCSEAHLVRRTDVDDQDDRIVLVKEILDTLTKEGQYAAIAVLRHVADTMNLYRR